MLWLFARTMLVIVLIKLVKTPSSATRRSEADFRRHVVNSSSVQGSSLLTRLLQQRRYFEDTWRGSG